MDDRDVRKKNLLLHISIRRRESVRVSEKMIIPAYALLDKFVIYKEDFMHQFL